MKSDHLVISHVDNENVYLVARTFARNFSDHVGIDSSHRCVHDLKLPVRKIAAESGLQDSGEAKCRVWSAHSGRLAKDTNSNRVLRLMLCDPEQERFESGPSPEKLAGKFLVCDVTIA